MATIDWDDLRVALAVAEAGPLAGARAATSKPTAEFDAAWDKGFLPPAKFVEMLWKGMQK
jgi:hypothetical protein